MTEGEDCVSSEGIWLGFDQALQVLLQPLGIGAILEDDIELAP